MAIISEVRFAHEAGALAHTLEELPEVDVRIIRETSTNPRTHNYYVRIGHGERERIQGVLEADPSVLDVTPIPKFEDHQVWTVAFDPGTKLLGPEVTASGGLVIDARSSSPVHQRRGWHERWLLPDQEAIRDIWQRAREEGFAFELVEVHRGGFLNERDQGRNALTDHQRRALEAAYDGGYYAEPRETSLEALGRELDLSASATGGRLRRGMKSLVGATLVVDSPDTPHVTDGVGARRVLAEASGLDGGWDAGQFRDASEALVPTAGGHRVAGRESHTDGISLDVYVEHPRLALSPTIRSLPSVDIGVVSDAGTDPNHAVYFFWVEADDIDAVETAFDDDPTVGTYEPVTETAKRRTYGIEYTDEALLITPAITDIGALVDRSRSHSNGWLLTLHLQDHETLNRINEYLDRTTFHFEVFELQRGGADPDGALFDLTEAQIEALVCAYVQGYYDDPREISLDHLGSILGLSQTAVSGRLRRGSSRLIEGVLEK